jgi:hypothetical protein
MSIPTQLAIAAPLEASQACATTRKFVPSEATEGIAREEASQPTSNAARSEMGPIP